MRLGSVIVRGPLSEAVIELRRHFGETQQQFSQRLNVAAPTVGRWESGQAPRGKRLDSFVAMAREAGREDLVIRMTTPLLETCWKECADWAGRLIDEADSLRQLPEEGYKEAVVAFAEHLLEFRDFVIRTERTIAAKE